MSTPEPSRPASLNLRDAGLRILGVLPPSFDSAPLSVALPRLIDAMSDAVVIVDRTGNVIAANRRFAEAFGLEGRPMDGAPCPRAGNCMPVGSSVSGPPCLACDIAHQREPRRALQVVPDGSGQQRRWEGTLNPVLDDEGEVSMVVEVWRDVTDRTQLEAQLSHSERLAALGMLAAGVAHEINNPLASLLAGVESLQRWLARANLAANHEPEEAAEVLEVLERETRRCRETTDKLLLLGQPLSTHPGWVDLNRAVNDTLALLRFAIRKQGITPTTELDVDLPLVWGREGALRGVLMNLCMNAVQAMAEGGQLTVRTSHSGERVRIVVEDDGPGISPDHQPRIWDPFFTTKPVGQGTGLGLSITQRIVVSHGGSVQVESQPGAGARFTVSLPLQGVGGQLG